MRSLLRASLKENEAVNIYHFHFLDDEGIEIPHFVYAKAVRKKSRFVFFERTTVSGFREIVEASQLCENLSTKSCLNGYIKRKEEILDYYKGLIKKIEHELSVIKYIDPDKLPQIEQHSRF